MPVEPHPLRVHVDPELPPLPPHAGIAAADPFEAEVWVRAAPLGSWPHRVAAVAVADDPEQCAADLTITPAQYTTGGIDAVMRAYRRRLAARPRAEDRLDAWLEAVRAETGADGVAFHGPSGDARAGTVPPAAFGAAAPVGSPAPQIRVHEGPPPTAVIVVQTLRPDGAGVLVAARRDAGRAWAEATLPELAACAAAMTAATQLDRAAASEARLELVRAMLGVTVHDVRGALFGLELGTRLLARVPDADPVRSNLQGSVGTPLVQVRQTLSAVRTLLEPAPDAPRAPWSLEDLWAGTVAELTKDRPAPPLVVEQPLDGVHTSIPRESVRRVLSALVDNALVYGPPDAPVRVRWSPAGGGRRVEIRNRGRLPFADLAAIEPFAHRSPRRVGLGLWVARSEAARHGIVLTVVQDGEEVVAVAEIPGPEIPGAETSPGGASGG